jgi:hypothetical protein
MDVAGFAHRLIDHRVKRDDAADELASFGLRIRRFWLPSCEHAGKSARNLGRQIGE